jgi:hypothetical protein
MLVAPWKIANFPHELVLGRVGVEAREIPMETSARDGSRLTWFSYPLETATQPPNPPESGGAEHYY